VSKLNLLPLGVLLRRSHIVSEEGLHGRELRGDGREERLPWFKDLIRHLPLVQHDKKRINGIPLCHILP